MGSSSSKTKASLKREGFETSTHHQTSTDPAGSKKQQYQTSIYGWGRLNHPFKPQRNGKHQNGDPLVGKLKSKTNHQQRQSESLIRENEFATDPKPGVVHQNGSSENGRKHVASVNIPIIQGKPSLTNGIITGNGSTNGDIISNGDIQRTSMATVETHEISQTFSSSTTTTSIVASNAADTNSNNGTTGKTTPFKKQVLSNPSFYGHYICGNCKNYWRSGKSKDGVAQECVECGTPTTPRR